MGKQRLYIDKRSVPLLQRVHILFFNDFLRVFKKSFSAVLSICLGESFTA